LAPADVDGLECIFYCFCTAGRCEMDGKCFQRIMKDAGFMDKTFNQTALELIFNHTSVKPKGAKFIDFCQFDIALEIIAEKRGVALADMHERLLNLTSPSLKGTRAEYCRFHDDKSTYTGSSKIDGDSALQDKVKPTTAPGRAISSRSLSRSGTASGSLSRTLSRKCTSLDDPSFMKADNHDMYKLFGLHTPLGRLLRNTYASDELIGKSKPESVIMSLCNMPPLRASSSPGRMRRTSSLPALVAPADDRHDMSASVRRCMFAHNPPKLWTSPFLGLVEEYGAGSTKFSTSTLSQVQEQSRLATAGGNGSPTKSAKLPRLDSAEGGTGSPTKLAPLEAQKLAPLAPQRIVAPMSPDAKESGDLLRQLVTAEAQASEESPPEPIAAT